MKEDNTVEKCKDPEDKRVNQWALDYWEKRALKPRTLEIFEKKYGFDPKPGYDSGFVVSFFDWPGGGGNLNYPRIYSHGLAAMIKEVEERQAALDMRLPNASKLYFYEASLIIMRSIIRLAHRYAELARDMAAKEKDATRKAELIAIAETCEWVPEHPARNLREAIQCHFFCHLCAELEQVGCGYSEAYLGQNLEPYYQADKAAGLIGPEDATFMLQNLFIKLNEIGYYFGEKVAIQNSADLGQSISLGGFTEDGEDATAEMDYLVLDAANSLMAMKKLVYDDKKITMAELQKALAANWAGEHEKVRKMCFEDAPKHGNDIPEMNRLAHRVYESIFKAFNNVDNDGYHIQFNVLDTNILRDAQKHPEQDRIPASTPKRHAVATTTL
jgi:trans-4-hydroxy-L-proline dehydratase